MESVGENRRQRDQELMLIKICANGKAEGREISAPAAPVK
jgi:hypothetical protein